MVSVEKELWVLWATVVQQNHNHLTDTLLLFSFLEIIFQCILKV